MSTEIVNKKVEDLGNTKSDIKPRLNEDGTIQFYASTQVKNFKDGKFNKEYGKPHVLVNASQLEQVIEEFLYTQKGNDIPIRTFDERNIYALIETYGVLKDLNPGFFSDKTIKLKKQTLTVKKQVLDKLTQEYVIKEFDKVVYGIELVIHVPTELSKMMRDTIKVKRASVKKT